MYIELQYTLDKLSPAVYVCVGEESDSPAMHLCWSIYYTVVLFKMALISLYVWYV